jgi:hypothetical protein
MSNLTKSNFLESIKARYGEIRSLPGSLSLFEVGKNPVRVYVRYSKVHPGGRTFYGLRCEDLKQLEGRPSLIVFLWDVQKEPLFLLYADYEELFNTIVPAKDGQFKAQILFGAEATELYVANAGRFNVEGRFGWDILDRLIARTRTEKIPSLTHPQIQTLLGAIGNMKGFDIWIPSNDRGKLDKQYGDGFPMRDEILGIDSVKGILKEIDVVWVQRGSSDLRALFEVEHTTPIYSGLLRFNDIHLVAPQLNPRFTIVANEERRALFVRQVNRPTFQLSGISKLCTFLEYYEIYDWFNRVNSTSAKRDNVL